MDERLAADSGHLIETFSVDGIAQVLLSIPVYLSNESESIYLFITVQQSLHQLRADYGSKTRTEKQCDAPWWFVITYGGHCMRSGAIVRP